MDSLVTRIWFGNQGYTGKENVVVDHLSRIPLMDSQLINENFLDESILTM